MGRAYFPGNWRLRDDTWDPFNASSHEMRCMHHGGQASFRLKNGSFGSAEVPKLYEYLGIVIFFYSNEHEPVHVHGRFQGLESKIELKISQGVVVGLIVKEVAGKSPLPGKQLRDFSELVEKLSGEIVQSWIDYFVLNKKVVAKKIAGKL